MTRGIFLVSLMITCAGTPVAARDAPFIKEMPDGNWICQTDIRAQQTTFYTCFNPANGKMYDSVAPLSEQSLAGYQARMKHEVQEADCYCSRQTQEGEMSPTGIVCTGAENPWVLRERKTDPCALPWK